MQLEKIKTDFDPKYVLFVMNLINSAIKKLFFENFLRFQMNKICFLFAHFFDCFIIVERDKCYGEEDFFSNQTLVQGTQTPISNTNVAAYYGNQYADTTICSMCFCCCLFHPNLRNKRRSGYLSIYHL